MSIPKIGVDGIGIRKLDIPDITNSLTAPTPSFFTQSPVTTQIGFPIVDIPGCVEARNAQNNRNLPEDDPKGNLVLCDGNVPSYDPLNFEPEQHLRTPVQGIDTRIKQPKPPEIKTPEIPKVDLPAAGKEEKVEEVKSSLTERVDSYLEYVAQEWMTENQLAIEHGLKTEMTESFLSGMKGLFEEHYVTIPEDKYDVLESMVEKLDDMETKLNEQIDKNISLNQRLAESVADGILDSVSEGLASTQKEKLASLAESVEFESEEEYREKLETLKESYFSSKTSTPKSEAPQTLSEGVDSTVAPTSTGMEQYMRALGAFKK